MEQEYTTSKVFKVIYGAFAASAFGFTIYLTLINYTGNNSILVLPLIGIIVSTLLS